MSKNDVEIILPPPHCQYSDGVCDQSFEGSTAKEAFFIYPSEPTFIAQAVRETVKSLQQHSPSSRWLTWEDLRISGQIIFCRICQAIRSSKFIVANITTLNFNVLFEIGYAIGVGKPVLPVRDTTYERDKKLFDEIGIFDVLGYKDFSNSRELVSEITTGRNVTPPIASIPEKNHGQPIYYLRSPVETDGSIRIFSELKKSSCPFRSFDSRESPRLSLHEAYKQVHSSFAVVAHLMDPNRREAITHNARCAFVCGLAMAAGKYVLMLQEGDSSHPIDYRDVIVPYKDLSVIPIAISKIVRATAELVYYSPKLVSTKTQNVLERLDLGDVAAENEIHALSTDYFVRTPQFLQAKQGHARLVIGRKGSGKSALFYGLRKTISSDKNRMVLDLKPEGHQFVKLREFVLSKLSDGAKEHTLTAFWHYLLLLEIARRLVEREALSAWRNKDSLDEFNKLKKLYHQHVEDVGEGDFSERLMTLVNRLVKAMEGLDAELDRASVLTSRIYKGDIAQLNSLIIHHLSLRGDLWILFDNIDKGFCVQGIQKEDILIVRCLLEATRKIQRELQSKRVDCIAVTFIRRDVYDLLINNTPDRGKETCADLDWSDQEIVKDLIFKRIQSSLPELGDSFGVVWHRLFEAHVGGEDSLRYILNRTLQRPRDILNFIKKCIQIAASRSQDQVRESDILTAEKSYSDDMLNELKYELRDIYPDYEKLLNSFIGMPEYLSREDLELCAMDAGIPENQWNQVIESLLWFCFVGARSTGDNIYAYNTGYNLDRLKKILEGPRDEKKYVIHPAFCKALMTRS